MLINGKVAGMTRASVAVGVVREHRVVLREGWSSAWGGFTRVYGEKGFSIMGTRD